MKNHLLNDNSPSLLNAETFSFTEGVSGFLAVENEMVGALVIKKRVSLIQGQWKDKKTNQIF